MEGRTAAVGMEEQRFLEKNTPSAILLLVMPCLRRILRFNGQQISGCLDVE